MTCLYLFSTNYNKLISKTVKPSGYFFRFFRQKTVKNFEKSQHFYSKRQFFVNIANSKLKKMLTKCGLFCLYIPMVCNIKITRPYILCGGVLKNTIYSYLARETATAHATVAPTIGLLPMPIKPIIST